MTTNRVSEAQWEIIMGFMTRHPQLAKTSYNNTLRGTAESRRLWAEVALLLNAQGTGATKDAQGWSEYYHDKRSKVKKLVGGNVLDTAGTGGGLPQGRPLTEQAETWCDISGERFGQGEANVRVDPFASQPSLAQPSNSQSQPQPSTSQLLSAHQPSIPDEPEEEYPSIEIIEEESAPAQVFEPSPPAVARTEISAGPVLVGPLPSAYSTTEAAPAHPQSRQPRHRQRSRIRPLGPLTEARRILAQIERMRLQSNMATAAASAKLAKNIGELARQHGYVADELRNIRQMMERQLNN